MTEGAPGPRGGASMIRNTGPGRDGKEDYSLRLLIRLVAFSCTKSHPPVASDIISSTVKLPPAAAAARQDSSDLEDVTTAVKMDPVDREDLKVH